MAADAADVSADARAGEAALDAAVVDSVGAHDLTGT
jgi:hypothetical protein